jgi:hypothetical protein
VAAAIEQIEQCKPDVICISATPPAATIHARSVVRRLRRQFPEMPLVVGLWNAPGDLDKAKERIGGGKSTRVVPTLADGQEQIRLLIEPLLPRTAGETRPAAHGGTQGTPAEKSKRHAHEEGPELEVGEPALK